jgi:hypothetical protein
MAATCLPVRAINEGPRRRGVGVWSARRDRSALGVERIRAALSLYDDAAVTDMT